ncbi:MAG TPA: DnaJ domain-containing protein [Candidatus Limnocylindrales bacterium]|nr:DnaJ domain-containing protein [Candidatus Limnocylindrales bacterium]
MKSDRTDLYKVLQVDPSANPLVIQAAYRALAQIHHPDVSGDADEMKRLNAAWEVLGDARKRREYDIERAGRHAPQPAAAATSATSATTTAYHAPAPRPVPSHPSPARPQPAATPDDKAGPPVGPASGSTIRFGRYEGWTIGQVARIDPPFLEWLRRVPLGRALKPEIDLALQRADGARRLGLGSAGSAGSAATNDQPVHTWAPGAPTRVR